MIAQTERWENPMRTEYAVVIEKDQDGYYVGSVPALPGCHTQGKSLDQLLERMQEAVALWLEAEQGWFRVHLNLVVPSGECPNKPLL